MSTKIDQHQRFEAVPDVVFTMFADPEFIERKAKASGSLEVTAKVSSDGATTTLFNSRVLPAKLPGFARRFVGDHVTLAETQTWRGDAEQRTADFTVDFGGQPITFHGAITMRPDDGGTTVHYRGEIKCTVPLVGGKIEHVAKDWIVRYLDKEQRVGADWLAGDR